MNLADEIAKLDSLRQGGVLSEEEFRQAKDKLLAGGAPPPLPVAQKWCRSSTDAWIGGICGGCAAATESPSWVWRLGFVLITLFSFGVVGPILYLLALIFMPKE
ncbi:MAG: hypothetical protein RL095_3062 [Verrucomicrobiota bacterium]|jgi:phage shock protein PspC (stress-responsive transcriptional regulator)